MVNTSISDIGSEIGASAGYEIKVGALGDGTAKAGNIVGKNADGKVTKVNADTVDLFNGILDKRYDTDVDTAISDGDSCDIIVPQSGRLYRVFIADQGEGGLSEGWPLTYGTAGNLTTAGVSGLSATAPIVSYLAEDIVDNDTVALVRWA